MRNYRGYLSIKDSKRLNKRDPPTKIGAKELVYLNFWVNHIDMIVLSDLKRFQECDTNLIAKNLSESTCPVVIIETLPDPPDIRIDIRIVSFTRFGRLHKSTLVNSSSK